MITRFESNIGSLNVRIIGCQDLTRVFNSLESRKVPMEITLSYMTVVVIS